MSEVSRLEALVIEVPQKFRLYPYEEAVEPRSEGKWSRLQILGHLCDSAVNNLSRFIQAISQPEPLTVTPYNQESWVQAQQYGAAPVEEVLQLWISLNQSIVRVISAMTPESRARLCLLPDGSTVALEWLVADYVRHMEHHLHQIFVDARA